MNSTAARRHFRCGRCFGDVLHDNPRPMSIDRDPLWQLRHALAGLGLALLASVPLAALVARLLGAFWGDSYEARVAVYGGLLLYVVVGAGVLFWRVARHETRPVAAGRVLLWLASLWAWPMLWLLGARRG